MEHWCPIENYPHYYISTYGRVFSDKYKKIMSFNTSTPYLQIGLHKNGIRKFYKISRLVALHFLKKTGDEVDHIDRNKLNNHVDNLRWVSKSENVRNRSKQKNCSSKYIGVWWDKNRNKWVTLCMFNKKRKQLGRFDNEEDAGRAYDQFCREQGLTTALLNFPI